MPGRRGSPGDGTGLHPPVPSFVVDSPRLDGESTFVSLFSFLFGFFVFCFLNRRRTGQRQSTEGS